VVQAPKKEGAEQRRQQIGCATRGGTASRATEDAAIDLARQRGAELIFLYVIDASFAHGLSGKFPIEVVESDLRDIGELILEQAKQRAKEQGVAARAEIRQGRVVEEIERFVASRRSLDVLVVGHMSDHLREHLEPVLHRIRERRLDIIVVSPT
jgi:nucleotide-binding universal stress UspA family protein